MIKKQFLIVLITLCASFMGFGQVNISTTATNYTIDFDNNLSGVNNGTFTGTGFQATPTVGQLDSDAWAVTGFSDGDLAFGGTRTTANTDYTRGNVINVAVTTGGMYSYQSSNRMLMIQPSGSDWAPGTLTLRIQNNTGVPITDFNVAYDLFVRNDQARSNNFNFSYSTDNVTYTSVAALDYTSIAAIDALGMILVGTKSTAISSLSIANGAYFYIRWSGADVGGSGSRDEFALDNIVVSGSSTPSPELQLVDNTAINQNCGYIIDFGTKAISTNTDLTFDVKNLGSLDLNVTSFNITGDYTIVSPATPFTVTSGNSQTVTVRFIPTANNTRAGILTINNNDSNEGSCTVNLTGIGFTPAPEIDIERNSGGTIPTGSAPNIGYNTIFASTVMGNSTTPKTYHVANEGTADLTVTSISSSNLTEFSVSTNPAPLTISSGNEVDFEIIFSPNGTGLRTATITILSTDADEPTYTFQVQGNGECAATSITLSPISGPEGTIVTVSGGSNFIGATTVEFNGISASNITIISNSVLEVEVPFGATTGSLAVNNNIGCLSSSLFTVIDSAISSCEGSGTLPTDLFISEVTDHGSGSHTYIEIFNGTGVNVDLSDYEVEIYNNGNVTPTYTIALTGIVINNDVFVIAIGSTNATDPNATHGYDLVNTGSGINEDDNIRLINSTSSTWIDLWGDTSGNPFTIASKNYTYRRKNTGITVPSTTWDENDWEAFTPVDYTDIGVFDFSTGTPPSVSTGPTIVSNCNTAMISVTGTEGTDPAGLAYQWYASAPGDAGWTLLINDTTYSNVSSATLNILDTSLLEGVQYYCQIREDDADCYTASDAVQLTLPTSTWDGFSWDNGAPTINTIAIINGDYDTGITGNLEACNLIINAGNQLDVRDNTYVKVQNNVVVKGNIIVQTHGALVQVNNAGTFTLNPGGISRVIKETAIIKKWYEYTYWSSPVINQTVQDAFPDTPSTRRFWYNAQNYLDSTREVGNNNQTVPGQDDIDDNGNDWQIATGASIMTKGLGYAATSSQLGMFPRTDQATFEGEFHTGDVFVDIYRNDSQLADNNWNLLGNPYPSAINADLFLALNSVIDNSVDEHSAGGVTDGAIFFWSQDSSPSKNNNGNENVNFAQSDYAIINTMTETAGGDGETPNRFIPSGQGFFISYANGAPGTLLPGNIYEGTVTFNNAMRMADGTSNSQFFRTNGGGSNKSKKLDNKLWVNLTSDNGVFNQIAVGYVDYATNAYDGMGYDTPRNLSNPLYSSIYTLISGYDKKFAIQGKNPNSLNLDEVIPLGFDTTINEATVYTLSIEKIEGEFLSSNPIYLNDNFMNIVHNLSESDYSFTSEVGEFKDRFEIVFQSESLSDVEAQLNINKLTIIELNDGRVQLKTNSNLTINKVDILDLLGRTLYQLKGTSTSEIYNLNTLSQAAYIAKVELSNGQIITKKAIKRN